ncbi:TIGR01244 family sulfur transferase [Burkholderiaceae bacterium UC74_6]
MEISVQQIAPDFCVAPQLEAGAMQALADAGFKSVINNRPDMEGGPDQPRSADVEAAARAAGLEYRHLPVNGAYQSPEEIEAMRVLVESLPKPILAFCRSGARSTKLYMQATAV